MTSDDKRKPDSIAELLKFAGRREPVDAARAERVEQRVYEHWQHTVKRTRSQSRRTRLLRVGGGLALAAGVVLGIGLTLRMFAPAPVVATVIAVVGVTESSISDQPLVTTRAGAEIRSGSTIQTLDDSGVSMDLVTGHDVRVAANSRIRLQTNSIMLDEGSIYVDSGPDGLSGELVIRTSYGTVSELGTQYITSVFADSMEVSVREGAVSVDQGGGRELHATAGEALQIDREGASTREWISTYGDRWLWATELGRDFSDSEFTLREFLDWLTREYGLQVIYANDELEQDADVLRFYGSISGLDVQDALEYVTVTLGLTYTPDAGVITIRRSDAETQ